MKIRLQFTNWAVYDQLDAVVELETIKRNPDFPIDQRLSNEWLALNDVVRTEILMKLDYWLQGRARVTVLFNLDSLTAEVVPFSPTEASR